MLDAEQEVREKLPRLAEFSAMKLKDIAEREIKLLCGGKFKFDAADEDEIIAVNISTSCHKTIGGNIGAGKKNKIFKDLYFLLMANVERTAVIFTEKCMYESFAKEQTNGRVPKRVKLLYEPLSEKLQNEVNKARAQASVENTK